MPCTGPRAGAVKARTATRNELGALLVTAPAELRDQLRQLGLGALVATCAGLRPSGDLADPVQAVKSALRSSARRYRTLSEEITEFDSQLRPLLTQACPQLIALCGVAPIPASSGRTTKHRLSRGGDRQANRALYIITITRLRTCPRTRAYAARRTTQGLTKKDIIRCLKRYLAREIHTTLTRANPPTKDLEPAA